jgi:tripartite-type tricarboxylate transporter receptor subunit TctC
MRLTKLTLAIVAALSLTGTAQAAFPERPLRIVVPFAAGGTSDILARAIGQKLHENLGQPVVVENRTGANGNIGTDVVAKAKPDGYTMLLTDVGATAINATLYPNLPFDTVKDLAPVTMIAYSPHIFAAHPSVPVKSVAELVAHAKANPGKLSVAHSGVGSAPQLASILFSRAMGIEWVEVPYKGGAAAIADTVGGHANVIFNGMIATLPYVKNGQLRPLAVASKERSPLLADVPTIAETIPGFETGTYQGLLATGGTPPEILKQLNAEVVKVLQTPEMKERLAQLGADLRAGPPEAFGQWMNDNIASFGKIVKEVGMKPE